MPPVAIVRFVRGRVCPPRPSVSHPTRPPPDLIHTKLCVVDAQYHSLLAACCAVLCCAVLCCAVLCWSSLRCTLGHPVLRCVWSLSNASINPPFYRWRPGPLPLPLLNSSIRRSAHRPHAFLPYRIASRPLAPLYRSVKYADSHTVA
ncbi:hypothetical protein K431DRAFT_63736 [Polychaeton citri CBS 116435]|uniref:Uncharacterized protein n=1 Tax=Polychaeton citri CBS 116435 TaxID=1314669 RepID=A0A9P4UQF5_9PEZI|nr:hypothetical protein K431DRAFT_63736 [Polychaeton citri CBS 116435]